MEDRSHALIAIAFLIVFGIGAALIALWMLRPGTVQLPYLLEAQTSVSGLGPGSSVSYKGVQVGAVKTIRLDPKTHRSIEVMIAVDKDFPLPAGTYATISTSGFIGAPFVDINLGSGPGMIHTSPGHPARLPLKAGGLAAMMGQAKQIVGEVQQTLASVRDMLTPGNRQQIAAMLHNLRQASAELVELEKTLSPGARQLPGLIAQTRATLEAARNLVTNANALLARAQHPMSALGEAASSTAAFTSQLNQQTTPQLNVLLVHLGALVNRLDGLAAELQQAPQSLILGPGKPQPGPGESPPPAPQGG